MGGMKLKEDNVGDFSSVLLFLFNSFLPETWGEGSWHDNEDHADSTFNSYFFLEGSYTCSVFTLTHLVINVCFPFICASSFDSVFFKFIYPIIVLCTV